jgi:ribosomal protein S18 acetylase RimI-like enzyme
MNRRQPVLARRQGIVMDSLTSRPYSGADDIDLLLQFASETSRLRWPRPGYKKVGDMAWALFAVGFDGRNIRLWFEGARLIGYAMFEAPLEVSFDIRPGSPHHDAIGSEMLLWAEDRRRSLLQSGPQKLPKALAMLGDNAISATALDSDERRISLLTRSGYARTDRFRPLYSRSLADPVVVPELAAGLRLRHATNADLEARVDVHRDAWSVWGPSRATVEGYRYLRSAPIYNPELDVVLEDADGRFLSYCIGWLDTAGGFGHFEPVGCRPDFTGRGYARAVILEAMRRMRERGMHTALVATESVNERALMFYPSCGFTEVAREYYYAKTVVP